MFKMKNNLFLKILPSYESNDYQVRVFIDEEDLLKDIYLGCDPTSFFSQNFLKNEPEIIIGRCTCGCEGCSDLSIELILEENTVIWKNENYNFEFDFNEYRKIIWNAKNDYSWEDINRRVERLVRYIFEGAIVNTGYLFGSFSVSLF